MFDLVDCRQKECAMAVWKMLRLLAAMHELPDVERDVIVSTAEALARKKA